MQNIRSAEPSRVVARFAFFKVVRGLGSALLWVALVGEICAATSDAVSLAAARELFRERKLAEAQAAYEQLALTNPESPEVQFQLGELALRRNAPAAAAVYLEKAALLDPNSARVQKRLGDAQGTLAMNASVFSKVGHAKKTLAAYERAVVLDPNYVEGRLGLFEFYRQAPGFMGGGYDKALAQARAVKALDAARGRVALATLYAGEKQYAAAFAEFQEVLTVNPDDFTAHYQIGRLAVLTDQFVDRGLTSLRRCLELTPPSGEGIPTLASVHWRIGALLEKKRDPVGARQAYEAALRLDPEFASAAEALRKLK